MIIAKLENKLTKKKKCSRVANVFKETKQIQ